MSMRCPRCEKMISRIELLRFTRLLSINCPHCAALLSLSGSGRSALINTALAMIIVFVIVGWLTKSGTAGLVASFIWLAFGLIMTDNSGHLVVSPESRDEDA